MIHTLKVYFPIHYEEVQDLQNKLNIKYTEINRFYDGRYPGVTMIISNSGNGRWKLYMIIDAIKLLGNHNITGKDYMELECKIKNILRDMFGHAIHYRDHVLLRLDYRFDVVVKNQKTRMLLMHLYKKLTKTFRFQKKQTGKLVNGAFEEYRTTIYHSSKSIQTTAYLKMEERISKGEDVEEYEVDVLRFEVRLLESHLYYMEGKNDSSQRSRKIKEYMKNDIYKDYFNKYLIQIYHSGDYYKIDEARKKITESSLSPTTKRKLVEFLKQVSSKTIDTPLKRMSKETLKKRLATLEDIGINPILIPKNYPNAPSSLINPLNMFPL